MAKSFSSVNQAEKNGVQNANLSTSNSGSSFSNINQAEKAGVQNANLKYNAAYRITVPQTPSANLNASKFAVKKSGLPSADTSAFGQLANDRKKSGLSLVANKDTLPKISNASADYEREKENLNNKYLEAAYDVTDGIETKKAADEQYRITAEAGKKADEAEKQKKDWHYNSRHNMFDFSEKSAQGNANYNANADVLRAENPGNKIRYADDNAQLIDELKNDTQKNVWVKEYENLTYASEVERKTYDYILATEGDKAADEYLDYIRPQLNARAGMETAMSIAEDTGSSRVAREVASGILGGIDSGWKNVNQNFTDETLPMSAEEYTNAFINQDIAERKGNGFSWEKTLAQTAQSVGNMIPTLAAGSIVPGAGAVMEGLSTRGAVYNQLRSEGYTEEQADSAATVAGVGTSLTTYLLSGVEAMGGIVTGVTKEKLLGGITNGLFKGMADLGISVLSEETEELLQNKLQTLAQNAYTDKNDSLAWNQEDLDTLAITALTTVLLQAPASFINAASIKAEAETQTADGEKKGVYGAKVDFSKVATEVLNNPDARKQFETVYGDIQGTSKTEQAKYIAEALRNAAYQEQMYQQNTLSADEANLAVENDVGNVNHALRMTQPTETETIKPNPETDGQIGAVMHIREMVRNGLTYTNANEIIADPQLRMVFEDMTGITLSENRKEAKQQIVDYGKGKADTGTTPNLVEEEPAEQPTTKTVDKFIKGESLTPEQSYVRGLIMDGDFDTIWRNDNYRKAYEELTGEKLSGVYSIAKNQVLAQQNNTFSGDPTLTGKALEANGEIVSTEIPIGQRGTETQPKRFDKHGSPIYPKTHNKVNPITESANGTHEQTPYQGRHQTTDAATTPTIITQQKTDVPTYTLRSNPALEITQNKGSQTDSQNAPTNDTAVVQNPATEQPRQFTEKPQQTETITTIKPPVNENIPSTEKQAQSHSLEGLADATGYQYDGHTYMTTPEAQSLETAAARVRANMVGEVNYLGNKDAWTGTDIDTAMTITGSLMLDAIDNGNMDAVNAWTKVVEAHKTTSGKALQAWSKWARGGEAVLEQIRKANPNDVELIKSAKEFTDRYDNIADGDIDSVKSLIRDVNEKRNTGTGSGFLGNKNKDFNKLLDEQTDFNYLKEYSLRQLSAYGKDTSVKADIGQKFKTWQSIAQLLRATTTLRNIGGNVSFSLLDGVSQNGVGIAVDSLMSVIDGTGVHTIGFTKGMLNPGALANYKTAFGRSVLEIAGDVNMGNVSAYDTTGNRTNKMVGDMFERALSRTEQLLGYALNTTDEMAAARIGYGVEKSINDINGTNTLSPEQTTELAKNLVEYRLFKNNGFAKGLSQGAHDLFNILGFGGKLEKNRFGLPIKREGGFGVSDLAGLSYPGVPANLGVKALEYSPLNVAKALFIDPVILNNASKKNGKMSTEYLKARQNMAMDFSRGVTGTALMYTLSLLFKNGMMRYYDDENDYGVITQQKAEGKTGTMVNLSAIERGLKGEDMNEWRNDDRVMNIAWLQPINSLMAISYYMSQSAEAEDWDEKNLLEKSLTYGMDIGKGAWQGLMDMPIMTFISNMVDVVDEKNSQDVTAEDEVKKVTGAFGNIVGQAAAGMIPGVVSQTASALDPYQRDLTADSNTDAFVNKVKSSIPGLRNTLDVKTDSYGRPITNSTNAYDRVMNAALRPGTITNIRQTDVSAEVERLSNATGNTKIYPDRKAPTSLKVNGEEIALDNQAQKAYKVLAGTTVDKLYGDFQNSPEYDSLDDTAKTDVYLKLQSIAEAKAKAEFMKQQGYDEYRNEYTKLVNGTDGKIKIPEDNLAEYVAYNTTFNNANKEDVQNYEVIDGVVDSLSSMSGKVKDALLERNDSLRKYNMYASKGIGSELVGKAEKALGEAQKLDETSSDGSKEKFHGILLMDANDADKIKLINFTYDDGEKETAYLSKNWRNAYNIMSKYGYDMQTIYDFYVDSDYSLTQDEDTGEYTIGKSDGKLGPYEVASALSRSSLPDEAQRQIFSEFAAASGEPGRYDNWSRNVKKGKYEKYTYDFIKYVFNRYGNTYGYQKFTLPENAALGITNSSKQKVVGFDFTSLQNPLRNNR